MSTQPSVPQTLPADFQGWDKPSGNPPAVLPADFDGWDKPNQPADTRNGFQKMIDTAAAPDSAATRAKQSPLQNGLSAFGKTVAGDLLGPLAHPIKTASGLLDNFNLQNYASGKHAPDLIDSTVNDYKANGALVGTSDLLGHGAAMLTGGALGDAVADATRPALTRLGEGMKSSGGRIIDQTVGLRKADLSHGAQPGRAYLEGGGGPVLTMRGLADRSGSIANDTGAKLRNLYTNSDSVIPAEKVQNVIQQPIQKLRSLQSGPGGTGVSPTLDTYESQMQPVLNAATERGGFTPQELFDEMKKPIAQSTRWNDPTMFDLNKVRQENVGGIGGLLTDEVPEAKPLNKIYQGTSRLANRAGMRADTGQSPLTELTRKGLEAGLGGGIGFATHHPLLGALPLLADTIPARTLGATALFTGGGVLPDATGAMTRIIPPLASAGRIQRINEK